LVKIQEAYSVSGQPVKSASKTLRPTVKVREIQHEEHKDHEGFRELDNLRLSPKTFVFFVPSCLTTMSAESSLDAQLHTVEALSF